MNSKNSNKLQIKDYINIGIFSAILMVLYLVAAMTNVTPITYLIYSPATAFVGAIPYLFITTKIPKKGTVLLFAVVPFLYFLLLAGTEGMIVAAFFAVFAILAELILGNDRKNFKRITISYIVFAMWNAIGGQFRLFATTESYLEYAKNLGLSEVYIDFLRSQANYFTWAIVIVGSIVAAVVGIYLSRMIFKKHLIKAGIL